MLGEVNPPQTGGGTYYWGGLTGVGARKPTTHYVGGDNPPQYLDKLGPRRPNKNGCGIC